MRTFEEIFCERHRCDQGEFRRLVFWRCVPPHARWVAFLLGAPHAKRFDADRELIGDLGRCKNSRQVREQLRDFVKHPDNRRWLRRVARLRVSGRRAGKLTADYLDYPFSEFLPSQSTLTEKNG